MGPDPPAVRFHQPEGEWVLRIDGDLPATSHGFRALVAEIRNVLPARPPQFILQLRLREVERIREFPLDELLEASGVAITAAPALRPIPLLVQDADGRVAGVKEEDLGPWGVHFLLVSTRTGAGEVMHATRKLAWLLLRLATPLLLWFLARHLID